jgi:hypothetical protein
LLAAFLALSFHPLVFGQANQRPVSAVEKMPNLPQPLVLRDWKKVARDLLNRRPKSAPRSQNKLTIEDVLVARDDLPDGSYLSTVWLGLDHGFGGRPLIFETMRFAGETIPLELPSGHIMESHAEREFPDPFDPDGEPTTQLRYTSEEEASAAHHEIVRRIRITEGH